MDQLSKKEFAMSAILGLLLGVIAGSMIALSVVNDYKKCEVIKRENRILKEMVMFYQDQQVEQTIDSTFICGE